MKETVKNTALIKNLTLFFGIFLLFTDVFFLGIGIVFKMPLMRYVIYVKLVINSTNIFLSLNKSRSPISLSSVMSAAWK